MVKKKVGGGKRYKAVASAKAQGLAEPKWDGPAPPLHIQKKLARKVQFLDKVSTNTSTLRTSKAGVNKKTGRKKALPDLSTLGEVLDEVSKKGGPSKSTSGGKQGKERGTSVNTAKQRHHILVEESQRMQQVLKHPLYKKDPIAAITNHLQHTLPPAPAPKAAATKGASKKTKKATLSNDMQE